MRLINVQTRQLEEFFGRQIPEYAILSHTWGSQEVTFSDFQSDKAQNGEGWKKINYTCEQAARDGLPYAWIDTCSIDKSSSAELSEAINSMYQWYKASARCYVYLSDVHRDAMATEFPASRWFRRGWTLQELLAPEAIVFYDREWRRLGTKTELCKKISEISGVDHMALLTPATIHGLSVAKRMSWASNRETTRAEDSAYSLMGIFQVNMPLLYGEGNRAFFRLQEEIIKRSYDDSILAWGLEAPKAALSNHKTIASRDVHSSECLASSPKQFRNSHSLSPITMDTSFALTNLGLEISLPIVRIGRDIRHVGSIKQLNIFDSSVWLGILRCRTSAAKQIVGIVLTALSLNSDGKFSRARFDGGAVATVLVDARLVSTAEVRRIVIYLPEYSGSLEYNSFSAVTDQVVLDTSELEHLGCSTSGVALIHGSEGRTEITDGAWDSSSETLTLDHELSKIKMALFTFKLSKGSAEFSVLFYIGCESYTVEPGPAVVRSNSHHQSTDYKNLSELWIRQFEPGYEKPPLKLHNDRIYALTSAGQKGHLATKVSNLEIGTRRIYSLSVYVKKSSAEYFPSIFHRMSQ